MIVEIIDNPGSTQCDAVPVGIKIGDQKVTVQDQNRYKPNEGIYSTIDDPDDNKGVSDENTHHKAVQATVSNVSENSYLTLIGSDSSMSDSDKNTIETCTYLGPQPEYMCQSVEPEQHYLHAVERIPTIYQPSVYSEVDDNIRDAPTECVPLTIAVRDSGSWDTPPTELAPLFDPPPPVYPDIEQDKEISTSPPLCQSYSQNESDIIADTSTTHPENKRQDDIIVYEEQIKEPPVVSYVLVSQWE